VDVIYLSHADYRFLANAKALKNGYFPPTDDISSAENPQSFRSNGSVPATCPKTVS